MEMYPIIGSHNVLNTDSLVRYVCFLNEFDPYFEFILYVTLIWLVLPDDINL